MHAFFIETSVKKNKKLELSDLPFQEGDRVGVVVLKLSATPGGSQYPLRGTPIKYENPTEPVAQQD